MARCSSSIKREQLRALPLHCTVSMDSELNNYLRQLACVFSTVEARKRCRLIALNFASWSTPTAGRLLFWVCSGFCWPFVCSKPGTAAGREAARVRRHCASRLSGDPVCPAYLSEFVSDGVSLAEHVRAWWRPAMPASVASKEQTATTACSMASVSKNARSGASGSER